MIDLETITCAQDIERLAEPLLAPGPTAGTLPAWLDRLSTLQAAMRDLRQHRWLAFAADTSAAEAAAEWTRFEEELAPAWESIAMRLARAQLAAAATREAWPGELIVVHREAEARVATHAPEAAHHETAIAALEQEHVRYSASLQYVHDGRPVARTELEKLLEGSPQDRETGWRIGMEARVRHADEVDRRFDAMVRHRHARARAAGFPDFQSFTFCRKRRFDYGPEDCAAFTEACARHVVPLLRQLDASTSSARLPPWEVGEEEDLTDLRAAPDAEALVDVVGRVLQATHPQLGSRFRELRAQVTFDVMQRPRKATGGFVAPLEQARRACVFMNLRRGGHRELRALTHETGHALHTMASLPARWSPQRHPTLELAETAAIGLEFLSMAGWSAVYVPADCARAVRAQLRRTVRLLPWIASIDAFQRWVYTHPDASPADRRAKWVELDERLGRDLDWRGLETERAIQWHRQRHLFTTPFYYVEYAIALLAALDLWATATREGLDAAAEAWLRGIEIGNRHPLPEGLRAFGSALDFGETRLQRVAETIRFGLGADA